MSKLMGMGVSEKLFTERFNSRIVEDVYTNGYHLGEYRGKIKGNKFYFYISEDKAKTFTTVLKGKFDGKDIDYKFSKLNYTKVLMSIASLLWAVFSMVMVLRFGSIGFLGLLTIPIMLIPYFLKSKSETKQLTEKLRTLCKAGDLRK